MWFHTNLIYDIALTHLSDYQIFLTDYQIKSLSVINGTVPGLLMLYFKFILFSSLREFYTWWELFAAFWCNGHLCVSVVVRESSLSVKRKKKKFSAQFEPCFHS